MSTPLAPTADRIGSALDGVESGRDSAARREVHDEVTAAWLGMALGVSFTVCLLTGTWSHLHQSPPDWLEMPLGPTGLYRFTQGLHVICGLASVPLLLAKLWSVSPQLIARPAVRDAVHLMERVALLPLVGGSVFLLLTGSANIARWYPWEFFFPVGHWWAAWLVVGALLVHVALKAPMLRRGLRRPAVPPVPAAVPEAAPPGAEAPGGLTRRGLFALTGASAALLTLATAGQTVPALRPFLFFAPRDPRVGPQGLPVNRTAEAAGTEGLGESPDYRLTVLTAAGTIAASFTAAELAAMPQRTEEIAIACVEGWSASAEWTGVPVREVLAVAGLTPGPVEVRSAQTRGGYRSSELSGRAVEDPRSLLALRINGESLGEDHGAPLRLIAPNRPGVLQTKWVVEVQVL